MAITRAQQARQLYKDGKRVALSNGSYDEAGLEVGPAPQTYDSPQQSFTDSVPSSSYDAPTGAVDDPFRGGGQSDDYNYVVTNTTGYDEETGVTTPPRNVGGGDGGGDGGADDSLQALYNRGVPDSNLPGFLGLGMDLLQKPRDFSLRKNIDFYRSDPRAAKARAKYGLTSQGYQNYMRDRLAGNIDAAGNPIMGQDDDDDPIIPIIPQNIMTTDQATEELVEEEEPFQLARAFRADGGIMGGLADGQMDEMGRQMYGLGKLVKKATRAVKKIVKSPIGKAALFYAGTGALGNLASGSGLGGMFRNIMSPKQFLARDSLRNIFGKEGLTNIFLGGGSGADKFSGLVGSGGVFSPVKAFTALTALSALTPAQEKQAQLLADETGLDINEARNQILQAAAGQDDYRARAFVAGGGIMRLGYQEGGDAEPVAKKTMPLLDMGGKEKDYRETGGFVDMGRMERADDVPARLSKNEFVFTADAVRNAGDGNIDKGAEVMYNMMKNLEAGGDVSEESQGLEGARRMFQTSQRLEEVL